MQPFRLSLSGAFLLILGLASGAIGLSLDADRANAAQQNVAITDFAFTQANITINLGDTVRWENANAPGGTQHTTTSDTGLWDSGVLAGNQNFTNTFSIVGTFAYHCAIHPSMVGRVTVDGPVNTPTQVSTPTITPTGTSTNTPVTPATATPGTPAATATSTPTTAATATLTVTHTPTITTPATSTRTPISPIPDATRTPTPANTNTAVATLPAAATATPTPTKVAPLPPSTGSGSGNGPASFLFLAAAVVLVAGGLAIGGLALRRR